MSLIALFYPFSLQCSVLPDSVSVFTKVTVVPHHITTNVKSGRNGHKTVYPVLYFYDIFIHQ